MRLQLLTCCWGNHHRELFKKTALRSLSWTKNAKALRQLEATWNIITDDDSLSDLDKYCNETLPGIQFRVRPISKHRDYIDQVQSANIWMMEESIKSGHKVLLAPPDTIFGDGTVEGLWRAGEDKDSVIVVPHPRVLPGILNELYEEDNIFNVSVVRLVELSFRNLHDSWVHAERGHPNQSSYVGGVEWWRTNNVIQGTHRLPSPYLISFTEEDLMYFKSAISFGHFDHMWPGDILIPRGRQRYLASSDSAFIVEVTEADKNVPPIMENQPKTGFWRSNVHNLANAQVIFTFRGE